MTTLFVHELKDPLEQKFTYNLRHRMNLGGVRPYLYLHNDPAGTFTITLLNLAQTAVASGSFTASDIRTALGTADDYIHVYYSVTLSPETILNYGEYTLQLSSSGYTFSETDYIGWIAEHENEIVDTSYTPVDDSENSLTFQLWEYKRG